MTNNDENGFLIQILNELDLSPNSLDLYLKIIGKSPLSLEEIDKIVKTLTIEECKISLEQLMDNGLCISNTEVLEEPIIYYFLVPPYAHLLNIFNKFDGELNEMANNLPEKITKIFTEIKKESGFLTNLQNYISNFSEAKTSIAGNLSLRKADYEDGINLIPELKILLDNAGKFYEMVENVFKLHFQNFLTQVENIKQEIINNLEKYNLKKKQGDIKSLLDDVIKEKINELNKAYQEKLPDIFKKNAEILQQNFDEIHFRIEKIENEIRMNFLDLIYEYEQTMNDQEKTFNIVLEKEKEKLSTFDDSLSQKIFELLANIFNFISTPIQQNNQLFQFLSETSKQMSLKIVEKPVIMETPKMIQEIKEPLGEVEETQPYEKEEEIVEEIENYESLREEIIKSGIIKGSLDEISSKLINFSEELAQLDGPKLAKHLEDINEFILENKGFSVVLNDLRRWISDLRNRGKLDENTQKVLNKRIKNWIERLLK
jgi:hypothetical protein